MDISSKKSLRIIKSLYFLSIFYTFIIGGKNFVSSNWDKVCLLISIIFYVLYAYTQYRYGKKEMRIVVICVLILSGLSVLWLEFFVFPRHRFDVP